MSKTKNLRALLWLVRSGEINFEEFVTRTRKEYRQMAAYLLGRWVSPVWFNIEDVEQELYLGTWHFVWEYDETRAISKKTKKVIPIDRYVVYNAMSKAKTQLHLARGVTISGSPDRKRSVIETPLTAFGEGDGEGEALMAMILAEEAVAETALIAEQARKKAVTATLKACESSRERYTVLAIREAGSLDAAGRLLYDDIDHRIALRLNSEQHAERFVSRHARAVAFRIDSRVNPV